jgi:hypothetical protein
MSNRHVWLAALLSALWSACALEEVPLDPAELRQAATYRTAMAPVSRPYASALAGTPTIELWISRDAKALYDRIRPDATGSRVTLPRGTVIVRAVYEAGKVDKLTVMGKGAPGSNPAVGDWWYAVTTPDGIPLEQNGQHLAGKLEQCVACHDERGSDDYLFGVPTLARR